MLRRTTTSCILELGKTNPHFSTKFQWGPDIRMLDKDEKIPEATLQAKMNLQLQMSATYQTQFPHMDPLNPTYEQKRASNTAGPGAFLFGDYWRAQHHYGFRSVPKEMVDWRSTMYGDNTEELPYMNERLAFAHPDYTLAGLVYNKEEQIRIADTVPRTVDKASFAALQSPKVDHWVRWIASRDDRERKLSWTKYFILFLMWSAGAIVTRFMFRHWETMRRRERSWWDGSNAGTWKYGSQRAQYFGQAMSGGSYLPLPYYE
eukprot:TRINITY_DN28451_c0_g1_i1.p2 TRINITY_DN28451_c0_g1~~TRINITY_DN28451_c0_g1_i1.p2  ORF type:complete len:261 (+),score=85.94 TRINITY_DN28451_c0_g1_i1:90-872(+)